MRPINRRHPFQSASGLVLKLKLPLLPWWRRDPFRRDLDRGSTSPLILLDLLVAFDTIDYISFWHACQCWGWAVQFGTGSAPSQKVVLGDYWSTLWALTYGVPPGSILSLMLFNIKPLREVTLGYGLRYHLYMDGTQLCFRISSGPKEVS